MKPVPCSRTCTIGIGPIGRRHRNGSAGPGINRHITSTHASSNKVHGGSGELELVQVSAKWKSRWISQTSTLLALSNQDDHLTHNFLLALTGEAKYFFLNSPEAEEEEE